MSESSYENEKQASLESRQRALQARYHIVSNDSRRHKSRYSVITVASWCETQGHEYAVFRFVRGLERVRISMATKAARDLNSGETTEELYDNDDG